MNIWPFSTDFIWEDLLSEKPLSYNEPTAKKDLQLYFEATGAHNFKKRRWIKGSVLLDIYCFAKFTIKNSPNGEKKVYLIQPLD